MYFTAQFIWYKALINLSLTNFYEMKQDYLLILDVQFQDKTTLASPLVN